MSEEEREKYRQMTEAKLKEIRSNIDALAARAEKLDAQARVEVKKKIGRLREHEKAIEEKLQEMKSAGKDAMEKMKDQLDDTMDKFKGGYEAIVSTFHK